MRARGNSSTRSSHHFIVTTTRPQQKIVCKVQSRSRSAFPPSSLHLLFFYSPSLHLQLPNHMCAISISAHRKTSEQDLKRSACDSTTHTVQHSVAALGDHSGRRLVFEAVLIGESDSSRLLTTTTTIHHNQPN
jgi:hypothetical protein